MTQARHVPVLLDKVLWALEPRRFIGKTSLWLDGTLGLAGHARALLGQAGEGARLLGVDKDPVSLDLAARALESFATSVRLLNGSFASLSDGDLEAWRAAVGTDAGRGFDGILLDLGVSSPQLDTAERGFSFMRDGPLDMRMDPQGAPSAADWLASAGQDDLARILKDYGEERHAKRLARAVLEARDRGNLRGTLDLAGVAQETLGRGPRGAIHPATRLFQALRIEVNGELRDLDLGLPRLARLLEPGGRMAVISFHSLEDRLVKDFFRRESVDCVCPPGLPECRCGHRAWLRVLTPKPLGADAEEIEGNPRSRSAKLRVAQRI